jgi:hypothetical protein
MLWITAMISRRSTAIGWRLAIIWLQRRSVSRWSWLTTRSSSSTCITRPQVAVAHRVDGADELALDQAAHRRHRAAHRVDVGVELLVGVLGHRRISVRSFSRSGR